jgi:hypothetical protein
MDVAEFNCPLAFKLAKYLVIAASFGDIIYLAYSRRRSGGTKRRNVADLFFREALRSEPSRIKDTKQELLV